MMIFLIKRLATTVFTLFLSQAVLAAADIEREKRMADEIVDAILDGEPVTLQAGDHAFLGIYTETEMDEAAGAAIILHGRGFHPDWEDVVNPLRTSLPESGWNTLSLQMPVLAKTAKYYDYVPLFPEAFPRIEAGINYLREQGNKKIVLIAHSCGAHMAMSWIDQFGTDGLFAYIGIGMGATDYQQVMAKPFPLRKINIPVLDIFGTNDYPAVIRLAPDRAADIYRAGNIYSRQIRVHGADHYFTDQGDRLSTEIQRWLKRIR